MRLNMGNGCSAKILGNDGIWKRREISLRRKILENPKTNMPPGIKSFDEYEIFFGPMWKLENVLEELLSRISEKKENIAALCIELKQ